MIFWMVGMVRAELGLMLLVVFPLASAGCTGRKPCSELSRSDKQEIVNKSVLRLAEAIREGSGVTFPVAVEFGGLPRPSVDGSLDRSIIVLDDARTSRESSFVRPELTEDPHNCDVTVIFSSRNWSVEEQGVLPFDGVVYRRKFFGGWEERVPLRLSRDFPLD